MGNFPGDNPFFTYSPIRLGKYNADIRIIVESTLPLGPNHLADTAVTTFIKRGKALPIIKAATE